MKTAELSIFIIEDDAHFRETFIDVMSLRGVLARGAGSAAEALKTLPGQEPSVVVVDVKLPDMNGLELCRRLRRMDGFKKTPIILISASTMYNDPRDRVEGLLAGASLFLPKPITIEKLWGEIEFLIKAKR